MTNIKMQKERIRRCEKWIHHCESRIAKEPHHEKMLMEQIANYKKVIAHASAIIKKLEIRI